MIEDKWINFVLLNGWRLKAEVDEETGDMTILVSNENGDIDLGGAERKTKVKEVYKLTKHEEQSN
jgi:prophage maintenance system killer protein